MKKFNSFFGAHMGVALLGAVMSLSSCSKDAEGVLNPLKNEESIGCVPVRVHVSDFSCSVGDLPGTRSAESPSDYDNVKVMTLSQPWTDCNVWVYVPAVVSVCPKKL